MRAGRLLAFLLFGLGFAPMSGPGPVKADVLDFESLPGWSQDDHLAALKTFLSSCDLIQGDDWPVICQVGKDAATSEASARDFFEMFFKPVVIGTPPALFTGYFEPELDGSPVRTPQFAYPIYRRPPEMLDGQVWYDRATIEQGILRGRGLELAWLNDPVDVYFLQVQGSGRIRMPDGHVMRVGYAGGNGHAYASIGKTMVTQGIAQAGQVDAGTIQDYVRANPAQGANLMNVNPSYVFFRKIADLAADRGPIGALGRSITPLRSVAIDPAFVPLGAPVWIEKDGADPMYRLMVAQDTGGAIKGAQRADIFFGSGRGAGKAAGRIKDAGRLVVLLPIDRAFLVASGG
jgi:membrane-bound lytic murein transglycosylase A